MNNFYLNKIICAYIFATAASTLTNPLFVIKVRLQSQQHHVKLQNETILKTAKSIYLSNGVMGYFKGLSTTLLNNTKLSIQFPLYDYINNTTDNVVVSSLLSKTIVNTVFYPFDLIRTKQRNDNKKIMIKSVFKQIYKQSGLNGFYKGVLLYNLTSVPNFIIMMYLYETIAIHFKKKK